jgi:uncharacterized membrane protein YphA (DoxX/SURF4 family)
MKTHRLTVILRSVLGFIFVAGPLATALHLAPEPALPAKASEFMAALARTGYMLPLLWSTEILAGLLLLSGFIAPLGLILLAPVIVNIAAFHIFLAPTALAPAIVVCALEVFLAWQYRASFAGLLRVLGPMHPKRAKDFGVRAATYEE